ncbi:alpha/beta hydrolase [Rhodoplanes sp. Z2-YC6860]|uniref:alpha/beta hydrolase n=1 Tax=Rhodoplanes sp. Z2-YC6860 TaxID=674703 RepID=UPI00082C67CA|nr:alpha/beta fold hydrolase [Rhodoplanes sp. Z2-YC6860]
MDQLKRAGRAVVVLLLMMLAGCATRPGPEVLNPTAALVPGARVVTAYVATTREREIAGSNVYNNNRSGKSNYAAFKISIPPGHKVGQIEWPSGTPDPAVDFVTAQQEVLDRKTFEQRLSSGRKDRRTAVFVHGFNTNFQEALFRLAQMTADSDLGAQPILFAWPSEATVTGYVADKDAVTSSRDQLAELLSMLARKPGAGEVVVIGHSMGSWLVMEALRQLGLSGQNAVVGRLSVVLAAPDIDVDVFRSQMKVVGPLSPPMTLLVSRDDKALALSGRIAGERPRVGALDVDDPRVQEAALSAKVQIVDISNVAATDRFNHDRYTNLAALYPRLATSPGLHRSGVFVLDTVGATLVRPFQLIGNALPAER